MSARKIKAALKKKNINPISVKYVRGYLDQDGYVNGYDIKFSEEFESAVLEVNESVQFGLYMDFENIQEVMKWIETLPALEPLEGGE